MPERTRIFTLLSGGIDSTTVLAQAVALNRGAEFECVTVDYGQRHKKEIQAAAQIAAHYGAEHHTIKIPRGLLSGMLVDKTATGELNDEIPNVDYADLPEGISPTYVSYRNGTMLSLLAARAQTWVMQQHKRIDAEYEGGWILDKDSQRTLTIREAKEQVNAHIHIGVHADDAARWAYPDCTPEFIGAQANAIFIGSYQRVRLHAPFMDATKAHIVGVGLAMRVPYHLTWSCYKGEELHCGICPTCRSRRDAFTFLRQAGLATAIDPTKYAQDYKDIEPPPEIIQAAKDMVKEISGVETTDYVDPADSNQSA